MTSTPINRVFNQRHHTTVPAIVRVAGLTMRDLFGAAASASAGSVPPIAPTRQVRRSKHRAYRDAGGRPVGVVVRWDAHDGEQVLPVSLELDGRWAVAATPSPRSLSRQVVLGDAGREGQR